MLCGGAGDREGFILLGQRLVADVVTQTIRTARLRSYRDDLFSVGMVALVEHFDRATVSPVAAIGRPFGFYRRLVYLKLLQFCYSQRLLRRKGAKTPITISDTDKSARCDDGWSFIANVAGKDDSPVQSLGETIELCLRAAAESATVAKGRERSPMAFNAGITATPKELRARGMTWKAIGEVLGISPTAAYRAAHSTAQRSPQELRRQAVASREARARAKARWKPALAIA